MVVIHVIPTTPTATRQVKSAETDKPSCESWHVCVVVVVHCFLADCDPPVRAVEVENVRLQLPTR
jgi:hypothetical protein